MILFIVIGLSELAGKIEKLSLLVKYQCLGAVNFRKKTLRDRIFTQMTISLGDYKAGTWDAELILSSAGRFKRLWLFAHFLNFVA
jgi:hypothetical protein